MKKLLFVSIFTFVTAFNIFAQMNYMDAVGEYADGKFPASGVEIENYKPTINYEIYKVSDQHVNFKLDAWDRDDIYVRMGSFIDTTCLYFARKTKGKFVDIDTEDIYFDGEGPVEQIYCKNNRCFSIYDDFICELFYEDDVLSQKKVLSKTVSYVLTDKQKKYISEAALNAADSLDYNSETSRKESLYTNGKNKILVSVGDYGGFSVYINDKEVDVQSVIQRELNCGWGYYKSHTFYNLKGPKLLIKYSYFEENNKDSVSDEEKTEDEVLKEYYSVPEKIGYLVLDCNTKKILWNGPINTKYYLLDDCEF